MKSLYLLSVFTGTSLAQVGAYMQCGGRAHTGETACISGYSCKSWNEWYSQCVPGDSGSQPGPATTAKQSTAKVPVTTLRTSTKAGAVTTPGTVPKPVTTSGISKVSTIATTSSPKPTGGAGSGGGSGGGLKWLGVDESVAEFGQGNYPGTYGTHYTFPDESAIGTLVSEGYNMFRVSFAMERLAVGSLTASFAPAYLSNLSSTIEYITSSGAWAVLDPHNYGRYDGSIITNTDGFQTFWKNLASEFKSNDKVVFDTNNEYHDMDQSLVFKLNQAAIDGIRAAGATSQYIFVEGNSWSGAWHWAENNDNLADLTDPENKIVYEMHQYLDADGSGTAETCVSSTIGAERLATATKWLQEKGKLGILGEFAGAGNSVCEEAVTGLLDHLSENSDVWLGALWWAAGPWWKDYMFSFEPPSGKGYVYYNSLLKKYLP